ncbi:hypothetical protein HZS_1904 [Henneguya salminicola]|nr:hypothetical protein HZS_1904 [Henneguya salminicola]
MWEKYEQTFYPVFFHSHGVKKKLSLNFKNNVKLHIGKNCLSRVKTPYDPRDAAHKVLPISGQGLNLGLGDAELLSNLIFKNLSTGNGLDYGISSFLISPTAILEIIASLIPDQTLSTLGL